jgi:hypothetical protein
MMVLADGSLIECGEEVQVVEIQWPSPESGSPPDAVGMWSLDSHKVSFMSEFASNWGLILVSIAFAAPVVFLKIKDHVTIEDDLKGTDEAVAGGPQIIPREGC